MKIHFIGDLNGDIAQYESIINLIEKLGHRIVTKHFIKRSFEELKNETDKDAADYSKKMKKWINGSDAVIVEITKPGLGSGYEISTALALSKPVIVLFKENQKNSPHVLKGIESDKLQVMNYNMDNLSDLLNDALDYASSQQDTRFNFFVAPKHINFLDWVAKNKKIPRSVFLRRLIEREIANDEQYSNQ
ncbi:MAG: hypothetical protein OEX81_00225 [Candidatus Pacebacteria bacterium]|nr:hypothetical protein [Candidatus Paceibacterota bacterium]